MDTCPVDPAKPFGEMFFDDPPAVLAWFREHEPVTKVRLPNGLDAWLISRYQDVRQALADPRLVHDTRRYPPAWANLDWHSPAGDMISAYGRSLSSSDPPEHDLLQAPVVRAFTTKRTERLRGRIKEICDALLDRLPTAQPVDLLAEYAMPLSVTVMCEIVGVPGQDRHVYLDFVRHTVSVDLDGDVEALRAGAQRSFELLEDYVERSWHEPHDDLMGEIVASARECGISKRDAVTFLFHLFVAGFDTTAAFIGNAVEILLARPELRTSDIPRLVEELLRYDGSARMGVWRFTAEDVEFGGRRIPEGEIVIVCLNGANRDPAKFAQPDRIDPTRDNGAHLAFGRGRHHCTGASLARVEAQVAIATLLRRFPGTRLAGTADELIRRRVVTLNGRCELPVTLGGQV